MNDITVNIELVRQQIADDGYAIVDLNPLKKEVKIFDEAIDTMETYYVIPTETSELSDNARASLQALTSLLSKP